MNRHLSAFLASTSVFGIGLPIGWTSPTMKKLQQMKVVTESQVGWVASAHEVGHFISPLPAGYLLGKIGRVWCLVLSSLLCAVGWGLVIVYENDYEHIALLYGSRVLFGLAMGVVFTVVPLYIAEVASDSNRGGLSTLFQAMLYLAHLIQYIMGPYVTVMELAVCNIILTATWLLAVIVMRESPVYLVQKGHSSKAKDTIAWLSGIQDESFLAGELRETEEMVDAQSGRSVKDLFCHGYRSKLAVVCFAAGAQRFTGMSSVVAYAASTFPSTKGFLDSDQYTILFGALVFLFTVVPASSLDSLGRRPLMLVSACGCGIAHAVTAVYFACNTDSFTWIPFITITSFSILYSLGIGPIVNTLQGELFPPELKGYASSLTTVVHAATSFVVTKSFQVVEVHIGLYANFIIYAILCFISTAITYYFVPETKQRSLTDTQAPED